MDAKRKDAKRKRKRKDDLKTQTRFRSDRIFEHNSEWFFYTREGTIEGPFKQQLEASHHVKIYIEMMASRLAGELSRGLRGLTS